MTCVFYGGHPELSCATHGPPTRGTPCDPCELIILRGLMVKAQRIILDLSDGDVANYVDHVDGCPGDDTCEPGVCKEVAAMNAVMGWGRR